MIWNDAFDILAGLLVLLCEVLRDGGPQRLTGTDKGNPPESGRKPETRGRHTQLHSALLGISGCDETMLVGGSLSGERERALTTLHLLPAFMASPRLLVLLMMFVVTSPSERVTPEREPPAALEELPELPENQGEEQEICECDEWRF